MREGGMRRIVLALGMVLLAAGAALAEGDAMRIGGDVFRAGQTVTHDGDETDDLFMAGETLRVRGPSGGSAHLAGRRIVSDAPVGGDLYAAGMELELTGTVTGDATLAGYTLQTGEVGGDLRASGAELTIDGPVGGYALLAGERVTLNAPLAADAHVTARTLDFGPEATVAGRLTLYEEDPGSLEVPARVVPADRVARRPLEEWDGAAGRRGHVGWWGVLGRFLLGLLVVAGLAALAAALAPKALADMRRRLLDRPWRALWFGFVAESALIGAGVLLAMTLIGIVLFPAMAFLAGLAGAAGYVVGVYAFGLGMLRATGLALPADWRERSLAAATGAVAAGLLGLVPVLGWLFVLALTLAGLGAITLHTLRPRFFGGAAV
jgi:hypothetical protein